MLQTSDKQTLRDTLATYRRAGERIAFVPTMGFLHAGHLALMQHARTLADRVVVSIFVNPTQFGPNEDLSRYPRDPEGDASKAGSVGVDLIFSPEPATMYPTGFQTYVEVRELERGLCGDRRPGHFVGVATVVCKLFHLVQPDVAVFGEKDYQQLQVIRRMVKDLDLPVEVASLPTVREADGLAMSSRNSYLSPTERQTALALSRVLQAARRAVAEGATDGAMVRAAAQAELEATPGVRVDYVELRDAESLETVAGEMPGRAVLAVAAFVGKTRLIDNVVLERGQPGETRSSPT